MRERERDVLRLRWKDEEEDIASATARGEESEVMRQKGVLITGSTKGLGLELANQFLREGDKVCVILVRKRM